MLRRMILGVCIQVMNQLTGINLTSYVYESILIIFAPLVTVSLIFC